VADGPLHLALHLAILDRLALVALVLAARQRDLHLGAHAAGEVDARRDEREALLARLADQPLDLRAVHEQLARALGLVVLPRGRAVGRDVDVVEPDLAVVDGGVAVLDLRLALAQRLDFGAGQHHARLPLVEEVEAVRRLPVGRHVARSRLALGLRHGTPIQPTRRA
jgi:hypothetical protein